MPEKLQDIVDQLESLSTPEPSILRSALEVLDAMAKAQSGRRQIGSEAATNADDVLQLIAGLLPGWSIHITGKALENGQWKCTLRRSDSRDNDEFIGSGRGAILANALMAALLRTVEFQSEHGQPG